MAKLGVIIEVYLRIQSQKPVVGGDHQWVDLDQGTVLLLKRGGGVPPALDALLGFLSCTSSISTPPAVLAMMTGSVALRSSTIPTYSSLVMDVRSSTRTRLTTLPSGPV